MAHTAAAEGEVKEAVPVEEYMPPGLSEEEVIQMAIQDSELVDLSQWKGSACTCTCRPMTTRSCRQRLRR
jgi:hypothetical protein